MVNWDLLVWTDAEVINKKVPATRPQEKKGANPVPLDIEPIKRKLAPYEPKINRLVAEAKALEVTDQKTSAQAIDLGKACRDASKAIEDVRKRFKQPALDYGRELDKLAKGYTSRFKEIETGLKAKLQGFAAQEELKRRKAEEAARQAQAELQAKLDKEAQANGVEAVVLPDLVQPATKTSLKGETGVVRIRKNWTFEVQDYRKLPIEFLMPNEAIINAAIASGIREIPGLRISQKETISIY
jgi:hypothetical protein